MPRVRWQGWQHANVLRGPISLSVGTRRGIDRNLGPPWRSGKSNLPHMPACFVQPPSNNRSSNPHVLLLTLANFSFTFPYHKFSLPAPPSSDRAEHVAWIMIMNLLNIQLTIINVIGLRLCPFALTFVYHQRVCFSILRSSGLSVWFYPCKHFELTFLTVILLTLGLSCWIATGSHSCCVNHMDYLARLWHHYFLPSLCSPPGFSSWIVDGLAISVLSLALVTWLDCLAASESCFDSLHSPQHRLEARLLFMYVCHCMLRQK
jgi:hypothetical protein